MIRRMAVILGAIAMVAIGAVVFVVLPSDGDEGAVAPSNRLNALPGPGPYSLVIGGVAVGKVTPIDRGVAFADVVVTPAPAGATTGATKTVGRLRFEPLVISVPLNHAQPLANWISESLGPVPPAPITLGLATTSTSTQVEYLNATIVGVQTPDCHSGNSGQDASFELTIVYTSTKSVASAPAPYAPTKDPANDSGCRFAMSKLETSGLERIAPFRVGRDASEVRDSKGQLTSYQFGPTNYSDLAFELMDSTATSWKTWFNELVVNQNVAAERSGTLGFWTLDETKELGRLSFERCGITRLEVIEGGFDPESTTDRAVLYCEMMKYTSV